MQHGLRITAVSSQFGSAPARVPIPEGRSEIPQSNKLEFVSSGDAKAAEGEEVTFEPDDASLNDAALIEELEGDEAELIDVIEDDEDDK
jgi:hypothetical protein